SLGVLGPSLSAARRLGRRGPLRCRYLPPKCIQTETERDRQRERETEREREREKYIGQVTGSTGEYLYGGSFSGRQPFQYVGTQLSRGGRAPFYFRHPGSEWWNSSVGYSNPRPVRHRRVLPGMTSFPGAARPPAGLPASCRYGSWRRSDSLHPRTACPSLATKYIYI
ncbi:hypothetical protein AMELA_G00148310, partial [Ameiurus melas]